MSEIKTLSITSLQPNPYRMLKTYPWVKGKLDQLMRSISDVGLWESIIARPQGRGYEIAFGHHRIEAAKRLKLKRVPVIVRKLSDEDMLKFMGRENGEDYGTEFLIMLNTWEGAVNFPRDSAGKTQAIEIARLLGWVRGERGSTKGTRMSDVAAACHAAHALIGGGYLTRDELKGLSVTTAKEIVTATQSRMQQIESMAEKTQRPKQEVEQAKRHVAIGAKRTAQHVRDGKVARRDLRGRVDVETFKSAREEKAKPSPLFSVFGNRIADQIEKMLFEDATATKLYEIVEVVNKIELHEDAQSLRRIDFALDMLIGRAKNWSKELTPKKSNVVRIDKLLKERG